MRWSHVGATLTLTACIQAQDADVVHPPDSAPDAAPALDQAVPDARLALDAAGADRWISDANPHWEADGHAQVDATPIDGALVDRSVVDAQQAPVDWERVDGHSQVDAQPVDAAPIDAAPIDAAPIDAAPAPVECGDVVGQWFRHERCLLDPAEPPPRPRLCTRDWRASQQRRSSMLTVAADGTFQLLCRDRQLYNELVLSYCDASPPTCQAAMDALDPPPVSAICDRPDAAECHCHLVTQSEVAVEGTWDTADGRLRLTHADGVSTLDCQARTDAPIAAYHPPSCTTARPIQLPLPHADVEHPVVRITRVDEGFAVAWLADRILRRALIDRAGAVIEQPRELGDDVLWSFALFGAEVLWTTRTPEGCALHLDDGRQTRRLADGLACTRLSSAVRGPDGIDALGAEGRELHHLQVRPDGVAQHRYGRASAKEPRILRTDDGLVVLFDNAIRPLPPPALESVWLTVGQAVGFNRATQTLFGVENGNIGRQGTVRVHLVPADGPPVTRQLYRDVSAWYRGADMHADGRGYRLFWADVRPDWLAEQNWATTDIFSIGLDETGAPIGTPQRLTLSVGGGATRPLAFPRADGGYTVMYSASRSGIAPRWEIMDLGPECFD